MKPKEIKWIPVSIGGKYPEEEKEVLLSYNKGDFMNFRAGTTEGFYDPFCQNSLRPERTEEYEPVFFEKHSGKGIGSVYAWAYKPDCMLEQKI